MKIALNGIALLSPLTGIGQYTFHLASGLQQVADIDLDLFYATGWSKDLRDKPLPGIATFKSLFMRFVPNTYDVGRFLQQRRFNDGVKNSPPDLYHEPNFLAFKFKGPSVITVHDLSWIRFPHTHPIERVQAMNKYFEPGLQRASYVITDSEFVKQELIDVFGLAPDRIRPVLLGVEPLFHPRSSRETSAVLSRHGLQHGEYMVAVGTLEPRKNLQVALRAYMLLPKHIRKRYPLVLVGMKGWHTSEIEREIAPLVSAGEIRLLGYVPRDELATVVAGALTLVYPSIYEGFGLPPLEAMACGVPVIASNVSSIPEVVGDTGLLIDPEDVEGVAHAMKTMVEDSATRAVMSQKALARSADFTWGRCVAQTLDVYREALAGRSR